MDLAKPICATLPKVPKVSKVVIVVRRFVELFEGNHVVFDDAVLVLAALCDVTQIELNLSVSH